MARCCGGSTCSCKYVEGRHLEITGSGTAADPFVFAVQTHLTTDDTEQFQLALSGSGTLDSPWLLQVTYSGGAGLNGLPDVDADLPDDGYVLGYDASTQTWVPQAPTTVAAGTNTVGNGIDGDGSSGDALVAVGNAARYISVTGSGIGLSDAGINRLVRVFDTIAARDAASPVPVEGTLAFVADTPDALYYYDGADWVVVIRGRGRDIDDEFLATSGSYAGGPIVTYFRQISTTTDGSGAFVALPSADLTNYSGVLSCKVIPSGAGTAWIPMVTTGGGGVNCRAVRVSDGANLAGASITATVEATLY
jgi:hypothetical protein